MIAMLSFVLKVLATVGGAILGWYVTPPVVRLLVRVAVHKPAPQLFVTISRLMGALVVASIVWAIWSFGFGDGWGFGPGGGSGPGLGPGSGATQAAKNGEPKDATAQGKDAKEKEGKQTGPTLPETLTVRMRGGAGVGKEFYLLDKQPMTLDQVRSGPERARPSEDGRDRD